MTPGLQYLGSVIINCVVGHDIRKFQIKISSQVFGIIRNPSGFGVFSMKRPKIDVSFVDLDPIKIFKINKI